MINRSPGALAAYDQAYCEVRSGFREMVEAVRREMADEGVSPSEKFAETLTWLFVSLTLRRVHPAAVSGLLAFAVVEAAQRGAGAADGAPGLTSGS